MNQWCGLLYGDKHMKEDPVLKLDRVPKDESIFRIITVTITSIIAFDIIFMEVLFCLPFLYQAVFRDDKNNVQIHKGFLS